MFRSVSDPDDFCFGRADFLARPNLFYVGADQNLWGLWRAPLGTWHAAQNSQAQAQSNTPLLAYDDPATGDPSIFYIGDKRGQPELRDFSVESWLCRAETDASCQKSLALSHSKA